MANRFARHLRRNATEAEKKLWYELRTLQAEHRHFRRQVPIAGYIVDFACHKTNLIVELDGGQHATMEGIAGDAGRSRRLEAQGFRVLRFWNVDVFQNLEGVVDMIRHAAGLPTAWSYKAETDTRPPPPPLTLPTRGRGMTCRPPS